MVEVIQEGQRLPAIRDSTRFRGMRLSQRQQRLGQSVPRAFIPFAPLIQSSHEFLGSKPSQCIRVGTQQLGDLLLNGAYFHRGSGSFRMQGGDQSG